MICQFCNQQMLGTGTYWTCHNHDDLNLKISYLLNTSGVIANKYYKYYPGGDIHYVLGINTDELFLLKYNKEKKDLAKNIISMEVRDFQLDEIIPFIERMLNLKAFL